MLCTTLREELMDVLYGEADADAARRLNQHLAVCPACRQELAALTALRGELAEWTVPGARQHARRSVRWRVALLAAAACLLLALGAVVGRRLGAPDTGFEARWREHETGQRREIEALRDALADVSRRDQIALLERVDERIKASEARQALLLATSLSDFSARSDAQRRYDLARVSASLSHLDGKAGQQVARTTELMGYLLQASQSK